MKRIFYIIVLCLLGLSMEGADHSWSVYAKAQECEEHEPIVTNPINLNYQFQPKDNDLSRREAADPACEYFNGYYWIFASKSNGYWK